MQHKWRTPYRPYTRRDWVIAASMLVVAIAAFFYGGVQGLSWPILIAFVLTAGSAPWLIYNIAARIFGWRKSHIYDLCMYWFELAVILMP